MPNRSYYTEQMLADEQFMQFPKWLMQDKEFSKLSNDAKVLYCLLKDRFKLSSKNHWIDKQGRVYVVCKRESMCKLLNKSKNTVTTIVNELIENDLIEEKHIGFSKPNFIYLLMPKLSDGAALEFEEDSYIPEDEETPHIPKNWDNGLPKSGNISSQELGDISNNKSSNNKSSKLLNNNIDKTYESKHVVVEEDLIDTVNNILYNSQEFSIYHESGNINTFIKAVERVLLSIKAQSKERKKQICNFSDEQFLRLLEASLKIENDTYGTFTNPNGYIVSKINEEIEKFT